MDPRKVGLAVLFGSAIGGLIGDEIGNSWGLGVLIGAIVSYLGYDWAHAWSGLKSAAIYAWKSQVRPPDWESWKIIGLSGLLALCFLVSSIVPFVICMDEFIEVSIFLVFSCAIVFGCIISTRVGTKEEDKTMVQDLLMLVKHINPFSLYFSRLLPLVRHFLHL